MVSPCLESQHGQPIAASLHLTSSTDGGSRFTADRTSSRTHSHAHSTPLICKGAWRGEDRGGIRWPTECQKSGIGATQITTRHERIHSRSSISNNTCSQGCAAIHTWRRGQLWLRRHRGRRSRTASSERTTVRAAKARRRAPRYHKPAIKTQTESQNKQTHAGRALKCSAAQYSGRPVGRSVGRSVRDHRDWIVTGVTISTALREARARTSLQRMPTACSCAMTALGDGAARRPPTGAAKLAPRRRPASMRLGRAGWLEGAGSGLWVLLEHGHQPLQWV